MRLENSDAALSTGYAQVVAESCRSSSMVRYSRLVSWVSSLSR